MRGAHLWWEFGRVLFRSCILGYEVVTGTELCGRGICETAADIRRRMAGRPVYLCFDMDFFDPSCAPGVCAPTWGGATAREGLTLLEGLSGLDFVAFDVNTVSPPHDIGGMTAYLAGTVIALPAQRLDQIRRGDRKSTRLNSSH